MSDSVNHPPHYNAHPSGIECITITEHMNFNIGNAIKYLWRAGLKTPDVRPAVQSVSSGQTITFYNGSTKHVEDLKKAVWYINREIERLSLVQKPGEVTFVEKKDL